MNKDTYTTFCPNCNEFALHEEAGIGAQHINGENRVLWRCAKCGKSVIRRDQEIRGFDVVGGIKQYLIAVSGECYQEKLTDEQKARG